MRSVITRWVSYAEEANVGIYAYLRGREAVSYGFRL